MSSPSVLCIDIDLTGDDEAIFDPAKWISKGRTYTNVPDCVAAELCWRLSVPNNMQSALPSDNLSIKELVETSFPPMSTSFKLAATSSTFSVHPPNTSLDTLLTQPIPMLDILRNLQAESSQAMLDGMQSITDWRSSGRYLPFSAIGMWSIFATAITAKEQWVRSYQWLRGLRKPDDSLKQLREWVLARLDSLPWNGTLNGLGCDVPIITLAQFLLHGPLTSDAIDLMAHQAAFRLSMSPTVASLKIIAPLVFSQCLSDTPSLTVKSLANLYNPDSYPILKHTAKHFGDGSSGQLYFVVYNPRKHWAAVMEDSVSCGIIAMNTVRHHAFDEILWSESTRDLLRIKEFISITDYATVLLSSSHTRRKASPSTSPDPPPPSTSSHEYSSSGMLVEAQVMLGSGGSMCCPTTPLIGLTVNLSHSIEMAPTSIVSTNSKPAEYPRAFTEPHELVVSSISGGDVSMSECEPCSPAVELVEAELPPATLTPTLPPTLQLQFSATKSKTLHPFFTHSTTRKRDELDQPGPLLKRARVQKEATPPKPPKV
ncbi:hypothetical protein JAAARDRAFT_206784 [Jaapia argillacea MUCL 33604]|uniref:Ubiquitin-like protease family profile domain-containing protein n=1 Tax=Jaapia argillacea MUCL 33604 TaxID=933084 RepID=A0A067PTA8_9AGAM|nr:hypothetical protein JAAARDRAFT_206784 [Jaapia argillacea MUCL 33604]